MAGALSNLRVQLTANAGKFIRQMRKAQGVVREFGEKVARVSIHATKMFAAFAAASAAAVTIAFTRIIKQQLELIDSLAKTADKLGLTTEALAGLQHAAKLAGVEESKLTMATQRMARRVSEAARGTGEAQDAIKELGLDAKKLNRLSPDRIFIEVARAMEKVSNQADVVRLGFKLLDSEGVDLVVMFKDGAAAMEAAMNEANELGLAISRFDAAKIEEMNNSLTRMSGAWTGLKQEATILFSPSVIKNIDSITEGLKGLQKIDIEKWIFAAAVSYDRLTFAIMGTDLAYTNLKASISGLINAYGFIPGQEKRTQYIEEQRKYAQGILDAMKELRQGKGNTFARTVTDWILKNVKAGAAAAARTAGETAAAAAAADRAAMLAIPSDEEEKKVQDRRIKAQEKWTEILKKGESVTKATRTPQEKHNKTVSGLGDLLSQGAIEQETYNRAVKDAANTLTVENAALSKKAELLDRLNQSQSKQVRLARTAFTLAGASVGGYNGATSGMASATPGGVRRAAGVQTVSDPQLQTVIAQLQALNAGGPVAVAG